jgi:TusA-related sulfurtransferase
MEENLEEKTPVNAKLDCIGFFCPEPLFQTRQKIEELEKGEILEVIADDPASEQDLKRFCKRTGNKLIHFEKQDNLNKFLIEKT